MVNYAHLRSREHAFPWATLQLGRLHYALELWQVGAGSWWKSCCVKENVLLCTPAKGQSTAVTPAAANQLSMSSDRVRMAKPERMPLHLCRAATGCATSQSRASRAPRAQCRVSKQAVDAALPAGVAAALDPALLGCLVRMARSRLCL